jgi:hypothetical protein
VITAERAETSTWLSVTPLINTNNRVTMTLEPHFVTQAASAQFASRADPTTRSTRTTAMVNNGQTIVLGGLLSSQQTNEDQKVPYLSSIPVVGEMFTKRKKLIEDKELVLFVTPFIIRDPSELQAVSIPDEHERLDDATAPPWKYQRKEWYKDLKASKEMDEKSLANYVAEREKLMDTSALELETAAKAKSSPEVSVDLKKAPAAEKIGNDINKNQAKPAGKALTDREASVSKASVSEKTSVAKSTTLSKPAVKSAVTTSSTVQAGKQTQLVSSTASKPAR